MRGGEPEWPAEVRRRVAYHEAGHAVAMLAIGLAEPKALSIGGNGGLAESEPSEMRLLTRGHVEKHLIVCLAGRACEQLVYGETTAGAGGSDNSDLGRATQIAMQLETSFGLGSLGPLHISGGTTRDLLLVDSLRAAVRRSLDRAHTAVLELLSNNRRTLDALADALFAGGYLDRGEIEAILMRTPLHTKDKTAVPAVQESQRHDAGRGYTDIAVDERPPSNAAPAIEA